MSSPVPLPPAPSNYIPVLWDWHIEHADRKREAKADAVLHDIQPLPVDRRVLRDIVREKTLCDVGTIVFLSSGKSPPPLLLAMTRALSSSPCYRHVSQGQRRLARCGPCSIKLTCLGLSGLSYHPPRYAAARRPRGPSLHAPPQDPVRGRHNALSPRKDVHTRPRRILLRFKPLQPSRR